MEIFDSVDLSADCGYLPLACFFLIVDHAPSHSTIREKNDGEMDICRAGVFWRQRRSA